MKIDRKNNIDYYKSKKSNPCDCGICKIYYKKIKSEYPEVSKYLELLDVDVLKPFELSWLELGNGEIEFILCQYIIFGKCDVNFKKTVGKVEFSVALDNHPNTNLEKEHFVLEFGPVFLNEED